jgi:hypothetical protein
MGAEQRVRFDRVSLKKANSGNFEVLRKQNQLAKTIQNRLIERKQEMQEYKSLCDSIELALALVPAPFLSYLIENSSALYQNVNRSWNYILKNSGLSPISFQTILGNRNLLNFFESKVIENFLKIQVEEEKLRLKEIVLQNFAANLDVFLEFQNDVYQKPRILLQLSGKCQILPHEKGQISAFLTLLNADLSGHGFFNNYYKNGQNPSLHNIDELNEGRCIFNEFENNILNEIIVAVKAIISVKMGKLESGPINFKNLSDVARYYHITYPGSFKMTCLKNSKFELTTKDDFEHLINRLKMLGELDIENPNSILAHASDDKSHLSKWNIEKIIYCKYSTLPVKMAGEPQYKNLDLYSLNITNKARMVFAILPPGKYIEPFEGKIEKQILFIDYIGNNPVTHD